MENKYTVTILYYDYSQATYKGKTLKQISYMIDLHSAKGRNIKSIHINKEVV